MKRILVTGAGGFIGSHILPKLVTRGYDIHAVYFRQKPDAPGSVNWHKANLLAQSETFQLVQGVRPTHLLHLAWYVAPGDYWYSAENLHWLEASIALIRYFYQLGGKRLVVAGTCAEYDWNYGYCTENITPCHPLTLYGICKNSLFETLRAYCTNKKLSYAWGRIFFLYGPGENQQRLVSSAICSLLDKKTFACTHGRQLRDFLHVADVASAFATLLDSDINGAVNIASGQPLSILQLILSIADQLKMSDHVQFGTINAAENEPPLLVGDIRKLRNEIHWQPRYGLLQGIQQTIRYWQQRRGA